eukprot:4250215-Prymnesium_polylepis.1
MAHIRDGPHTGWPTYGMAHIRDGASAWCRRLRATAAGTGRAHARASTRAHLELVQVAQRVAQLARDEGRVRLAHADAPPTLLQLLQIPLQRAAAAVLQDGVGVARRLGPLEQVGHVPVLRRAAQRARGL